MKIAILSNGPGNYSTKRLKEEAEKRGHDVSIIKYRDCYASIEQNNPKVSYRGEDLDGFDAIIPRIASHMTRYGAAIVRQFEMQGVYTASSSIAIVRARDKLRSMQLLAKAGVGIPKTVFSRNTLDIDDLLDHLGGTPVIIKLAAGTHGNGVVLAETKKAAMLGIDMSDRIGLPVLADTRFAIWYQRELAPGKKHGTTVAPERRIILAVKTFHSASTTGPNMVFDVATTPDGNSATSPPSAR